MCNISFLTIGKYNYLTLLTHYLTASSTKFNGFYKKVDLKIRKYRRKNV